MNNNGRESLRREGYELDEAILAGECCLTDAEEALRYLDKAEGWGFFDMFTRGGLISGIMKHSRLDEAQRAMNTLESDLRRFSRELGDLAPYADVRVTVDGFMQFADFFFDGFFVDFMVLDKIRESKRQVEDLRARIETTVLTLRQRKKQIDLELGLL